MKEFKVRITLPWSVEHGKCYPVYASEGKIKLVGALTHIVNDTFVGFFCDCYEANAASQGAPVYISTLGTPGYDPESNLPIGFYLSEHKPPVLAVPVIPENLSEVRGGEISEN